MKRLSIIALVLIGFATPVTALPLADAPEVPMVENITAVGGNRKITVSFPTPQGNFPTALGYDVRTVPAQSGCYIRHNSQNPVSSCEIPAIPNGYYYDIVVTSEVGTLRVDSKPVTRVKTTYDPNATYSISVKPSGPISKRAGTLTVTSAGSIPGKYCMSVTYIQPSPALLTKLRRDWEYTAEYISGSGGSLPDGTTLSSIGSISIGCIAPGKAVLKAAKAVPAQMGWKKPTKPGKYQVFATLYYSNDEFRKFRAPDELVAVSPLVPVTVR